MAIFGKPRSPFDAPEVYNTPGIGDDIPGNRPMAPFPMQGNIPIAEGVQPRAPGFFGKGGTGSKMLVGALGGALDGVARWGGAEPGYANAQRQWQEMQAEQEKVRMMLAAKRAQAEAERQDRLNTPTVYNTKAGLVSATPTGDARVIYEAPQETPEWQQYAAAMSDPNTTPQERQYIQQYMLKGNAPDIMQQRLNNQVQLKTTAPGSSGGGGGGGSVPKGIFSVKSAADYARLPSGTKYTAPDGSVRIKQ